MSCSQNVDIWHTILPRLLNIRNWATRTIQKQGVKGRQENKTKQKLNICIKYQLPQQNFYKLKIKNISSPCMVTARNIFSLNLFAFMYICFIENGIKIKAQNIFIMIAVLIKI